MKCCPFCGGIRGVNTTYYTKYSQDYDWDGNPLTATESGAGYGRSTGDCLDCGKRITLSRLQNEK